MNLETTQPPWHLGILIHVPLHEPLEHGVDTMDVLDHQHATGSDGGPQMNEGGELMLWKMRTVIQEDVKPSRVLRLHRSKELRVAWSRQQRRLGGFLKAPVILALETAPRSNSIWEVQGDVARLP